MNITDFGVENAEILNIISVKYTFSYNDLCVGSPTVL